MNHNTFTKLGQYIHGVNWKSPLARDLGRHQRSVQRYASGLQRVPDDVATTLTTLAAAKYIEHRVLRAAKINVVYNNEKVNQTPEFVQLIGNKLLSTLRATASN